MRPGKAKGTEQAPEESLSEVLGSALGQDDWEFGVSTLSKHAFHTELLGHWCWVHHWSGELQEWKSPLSSFLVSVFRDSDQALLLTALCFITQAKLATVG